MYLASGLANGNNRWVYRPRPNYRRQCRGNQGYLINILALVDDRHSRIANDKTPRKTGASGWRSLGRPAPSLRLTPGAGAVADELFIAAGSASPVGAGPLRQRPVPRLQPPHQFPISDVHPASFAQTSLLDAATPGTPPKRPLAATKGGVNGHPHTLNTYLPNQESLSCD